MNSDKVDRAENLEWDPPDLSFDIERHGGMAKGSSRAEVYAWSVNLETLKADCKRCSHRQIRPKGKSLDVKPLAVEIADLIMSGKQDQRLKWFSDGKVQVLIGIVIPETNKQTTAERRKRFRNALDRELTPGWKSVRPNVYERN